jgi:hypothetical protein
MRINYFVFIAGIMFSSISGAEGYQNEVFFFTSTEEEDVTNVELEITGIGVTHYFNQVNTSKGPLAEAEFLSRTSNAYFALITNFDLSGPGGSIDGDGFIVGGIHYAPGTDYFIGLTLLRTTLDSTPSLDRDNNILVVGTYLDERSAVLLGIASGELFGSDTSGLAFEYKRLMKAGGKDINVEFSVENEEVDGVPSETNTDVSLSGDYYISNQFSIGAGFNTNSGDSKSIEGTIISLGLRYFFTPVVSFEIEFDEFSADDTALGDDSSTVQIELIGRF